MKKAVNKKSMMQKMALLFCTILFGTLAGCSSDDSGDPTVTLPEGKNIKLTLTMTGVTTDDFISFVAAGGTHNPNQTTVWKLNGVSQPGETAISLNKNSFTGGTTTYVLESEVPMAAVAVGMQFIATANPTHSFTFSYKAEVNGVVVKEENNVTVAPNADYSHNYSY
ncbi:hypothetical protein [Flavobacterium kingsejongi]|jgi:hypothetical protein|uniref:Uncharacterized protein n=1 Tax=Flavobacterium kingsejongi TaxID=1678728 RepID=A0A2S1LNL9_9FLAO|nr:hypothetical protein [Flavobacterium kingsejongi]AWG25262.1 hypothetical protein FK004_08450 [Flavobacterium kingsejongi]